MNFEAAPAGVVAIEICSISIVGAKSAKYLADVTLATHRGATVIVAVTGNASGMENLSVDSPGQHNAKELSQAGIFSHGVSDSCESIDPLWESFHLQAVAEVLCAKWIQFRWRTTW